MRFLCRGSFQAKEVRRKADQMVQLGKEVIGTQVPCC